MPLDPNSPWYNPFDPPDPDPLASAAAGTNIKKYAAGLATAPMKRLYVSPHSLPPPLDPQERVSGGFGAVDVEDRTYPGSPGAFLFSGSDFDPTEQRFMRIPSDPGGYITSSARAPSDADFRNPIAIQAGLSDIQSAWERIKAAAGLKEAQRIMQGQSASPSPGPGPGLGPVAGPSEEELRRMKAKQPKEENWGRAGP